MQLNVVDRTGAKQSPIEVDDAVFGLAPNEPVVHQALLAQLAARRSGTHSTQSRGEVTGSTRKLRRQKGLGMARIGSANSPVLRGGGVVFGPKPRSYAQQLPKRMRRLAIRSVLSSRAQEDRLIVVDDITLDAPSTREMRTVLEALELAGSVLVVTAASDRNILRSARNLPGVDVLPTDTINVADMLAHRTIVMTEGAVRRAEALWGGDRAGQRRSPVLAAATTAEED